MLASESSANRASLVVQGDEPFPSGGDPLPWLTDIGGVDEIWVDWQLCPTADSEYEGGAVGPALTPASARPPAGGRARLLRW